MRVIIRGVCSNSGFGQATQGLLKTSIHAGYDTKFVSINAHRLQHRTGFSQPDLDWIDSITIDPYTDNTKDDILIDVGSLVYGMSIPSIPCTKNILYTTYETIKIHNDYVNALNNKYDETWTASNFNKVTFTSSGVTKPIKIIPHYVDPSKLNPDAVPMKIKNKRGFAFLYNADLTYRKGLHYLIPAFSQEFKHDEDVCLILKLTMSDPTSNAAPTILESVNRLLLAANLMDTKRPPILLLVQFLEYNKLSSLYTTADCYVSPFMGEGYAYTIAEAMMCKKPIIASRCAAPLDYLNNSCAWFIELNKKNPTIPITDPWQLKMDPRYEGQSLYHLEVETLKKHMRYVFEHKNECVEKGEQARRKILEYNNLDRLAKIFKELLGD